MAKIAKRVFLFIMLMFIYLPILILAVYSFTSATQIGAIRGFSMQNYVTLFTTPELTEMIRGTLLLALGSAAIATVLGTLGAIGAFLHLHPAGRCSSCQQGDFYSACGRPRDALRAFRFPVCHAQDQADGLQYL